MSKTASTGVAFVRVGSRTGVDQRAVYEYYVVLYPYKVPIES